MAGTNPRFQEIRQLVADTPWLDWKVEVDRSSVAELFPEETRKARRRAARAPRWAAVVAPSVVIAVVMSAPALAYGSTSTTVVYVAFALLVAAAVVRWLTLESFAREFKEVERVIRPLVFGSVTDSVDPLWRQADLDDPDVQELLVEWMLAKYELDELEAHINDGVQARKKLSPIDPMRKTMQIEIETLRARRDMLRADRQEQADSITQTVREQLQEKHRQRAEEHEREKYDARLREIGDKEQSRLQVQERAQDWLDGER